MHEDEIAPLDAASDVVGQMIDALLSGADEEPPTRASVWPEASHEIQ